MTEKKARNLLYDTANKLLEGDQYFFLVLQTGDSCLIMTRYRESKDFITYLPDVCHFKVEFDADSAVNTFEVERRAKSCNS